MARQKRKPPYVESSLIRALEKKRSTGSDKSIKTRSRRSTIVSFMVNETIHVHNGKSFIPVYVTEDRLGHKLGEFAPTRTFKKHSGDKVAQRRIA